MARTARKILQAGELEAYHRDGFVVPSYRLPADVLARLQGLTRHLVADNPELTNRHMVGPHVPGSGTEGLKARPGWIDIATHPDILDMIEQIVGPDIILWGSGVFYKRPEIGSATPWHQDAEHSPIRPMASTSVWIAVSESTVDNGCLRFIPGAHAAKKTGKHAVVDSEDLFLYTCLDPSEFDETTARDVELEPGQLVLFDIFSAHSAAANKGKRERAGYALRFMPSTSHYKHDDAVNRGFRGYGHDTRPLTLVRGIDRCGQNDFQRGHPQRALAS